MKNFFLIISYYSSFQEQTWRKRETGAERGAHQRPAPNLQPDQQVHLRLPGHC